MIWIEDAYSNELERTVNINEFTRGDAVYHGGFECDSCSAELIARKGTINTHHFASKTPHDDDCEYRNRRVQTQKGEAMYAIDLSDYTHDDGTTVHPGPAKGGRPEGSTNKNAFIHMNTLKDLIELDQFLENGDITRTDITGIDGRNWQNFFIKDLDETIVSKLEENEERNSQQIFVFKGSVNKIWNTPYGGYFNLKGKKFESYISSVQIHIPRIRFPKETQDDFNNKPLNKREELAVIGVPTVITNEDDQNQVFKKILFEIRREEWRKYIYQFDE